MSSNSPRTLALCGLIVAALGAACDEAAEEQEVPLTSAQKLCKTLGEFMASCGAATPCDQPLLDDCADVSSAVSDSFLGTATTCLEHGGTPTGCFFSGLESLQATQAHHRLASSFCAECAFGVPGCEELFFSPEGDSGIGALLLPFGDDLITEVTDRCAVGLGCAATFVSCAEQVIIERAIPENTMMCLLQNVTNAAAFSAPTECNLASGDPAGTGTATSASGAGTGAGASGSGGAPGGPSTGSGASTSSGGGGDMCEDIYDTSGPPPLLLEDYSCGASYTSPTLRAQGTFDEYTILASDVCADSTGADLVVHAIPNDVFGCMFPNCYASASHRNPQFISCPAPAFELRDDDGRIGCCAVGADVVSMDFVCQQDWGSVTEYQISIGPLETEACIDYEFDWYLR